MPALCRATALPIAYSSMPPWLGSGTIKPSTPLVKSDSSKVGREMDSTPDVVDSTPASSSKVEREMDSTPISSVSFSPKLGREMDSTPVGMDSTPTATVA